MLNDVVLQNENLNFFPVEEKARALEIQNCFRVEH